MKNLLNKIVAAGVLLLAGEYTAMAATYSADLNIDPTVANRGIFTQGSTLAPVGTIIWFVASTDANLGTIAGNTIITADQLLGSDTFLAQTRVDGEMFQGGLGAGWLIETISPDTSFATSNIFMIVFGNRINANFASTPPPITPTDGDQFGFVNLGVRPPPASGNADWNPTSQVFGTGVLIAVPEPSTFALAGLGLVGLFGYRRFRK